MVTQPASRFFSVHGHVGVLVVHHPFIHHPCLVPLKCIWVDVVCVGGGGGIRGGINTLHASLDLPLVVRADPMHGSNTDVT